MTVDHLSVQILTEQVCTQVVHKPHPEPDSTVKIQNPSEYTNTVTFISVLLCALVCQLCKVVLMRANKQQRLKSEADTAAISHLLICRILSVALDFSLLFKILFLFLLFHLTLSPIPLTIT